MFDQCEADFLADSRPPLTSYRRSMSAAVETKSEPVEDVKMVEETNPSVEEEEAKKLRAVRQGMAFIPRTVKASGLIEAC